MRAPRALLQGMFAMGFALTNSLVCVPLMSCLECAPLMLRPGVNALPAGYSANALHLVGWSCGKLRFCPSEAWLQTYLRAVQTNFFSLSPNEMSNIIWALAKLGACAHECGQVPGEGALGQVRACTCVLYSGKNGAVSPVSCSWVVYRAVCVEHLCSMSLPPGLFQGKEQQ